jgi:uncharacterized phage-associated protein/DNA-binding transcriptional regulator YiaG
MKSPFTSKEMSLQKELRTLSFRKENFEVWYHYFLCEDTQEQFTTTELDEVNISQCYNQYREKYTIPFPEQITKIREKYDINAAKMSEILGMGANSYRNYEQGEVPSVANGRLILAASDPKEFQRFLEASRGVLEDKDYEKIRRKVTTAIEVEEDSWFERLSESKLFSYPQANQFTCFVMPSFDKLTQMIVFFASMGNVWKTKLNKLLFYADYLHFSRTGYGISGTSYRAIQMGPVPSHFDNLYSKVIEEESIEVEYVEFENGLGERFIPTGNFQPDLFSPNEMTALEDVRKRFGSMNGSQLIEVSHQEKGWLDCQNAKEIISYQRYGFLLNQIM